MLGSWDGSGVNSDHMQTICATSLQTDNHTNTSSLNLTCWMLFLTPNQQCQSTEGIQSLCKWTLKVGLVSQVIAARYTVLKVGNA